MEVIFFFITKATPALYIISLIIKRLFKNSKKADVFIPGFFALLYFSWGLIGFIRFGLELVPLLILFGYVCIPWIGTFFLLRLTTYIMSQKKSLRYILMGIFWIFIVFVLLKPFY